MECVRASYSRIFCFASNRRGLLGTPFAFNAGRDGKNNRLISPAVIGNEEVCLQWVEAPRDTLYG